MTKNRRRKFNKHNQNQEESQQKTLQMYNSNDVSYADLVRENINLRKELKWALALLNSYSESSSIEGSHGMEKKQNDLDKDILKLLERC